MSTWNTYEYANIQLHLHYISSQCFFCPNNHILYTPPGIYTSLWRYHHVQYGSAIRQPNTSWRQFSKLSLDPVRALHLMLWEHYVSGCYTDAKQKALWCGCLESPQCFLLWWDDKMTMACRIFFCYNILTELLFNCFTMQYSAREEEKSSTCRSWSSWQYLTSLDWQPMPSLLYRRLSVWITWQWRHLYCSLKGSSFKWELWLCTWIFPCHFTITSQSQSREVWTSSVISSEHILMYFDYGSSKDKQLSSNFILSTVV